MTDLLEPKLAFAPISDDPEREQLKLDEDDDADDDLDNEDDDDENGLDAGARVDDDVEVEE